MNPYPVVRIALGLLTETFQSMLVFFIAICVAKFLPTLATERVERDHVVRKRIAICVTGLGTYLLPVAR